MARGKKTGGRNFRPGQSGNPKGPAPTPEDIKALRKLNSPEFDRIANKFLLLTKSEIAKAVANTETPAIELFVASVIHKGIIEGDPRRLEAILNRVIGKVKEVIEHSASKDGGPLVILTMPRNGREAPPEVESPPEKKKKEASDGGA